MFTSFFLRKFTSLSFKYLKRFVLRTWNTWWLYARWLAFVCNFREHSRLLHYAKTPLKWLTYESDHFWAVYFPHTSFTGSHIGNICERIFAQPEIISLISADTKIGSGNRLSKAFQFSPAAGERWRCHGFCSEFPFTVWVVLWKIYYSVMCGTARSTSYFKGKIWSTRLNTVWLCCYCCVSV